MNEHRQNKYSSDPILTREIPGAFFMLFFIFILALFFDAASTSLFMIVHGPGYEIHPVIRWGALTWGPVAGPLLGAIAKVAAGILLARLHRRASCYAILLTAVLSIAAGLCNLSALSRIGRGLFLAGSF